MAMKAVITEAEHGALAAHFQSEYKKNADGMFYLDVTPFTTSTGATWGLEDTSGLRSAVVKERDRAETAEKALKAHEGIDPVKARDALKKVGEMANWTPEQKVQEQIAATKLEVETKFAAEQKKLQDRLEETTQFLQRSLITESATRALAAAGGATTLLLPHVERHARMRAVDGGKFVVEVLGQDGRPRISPKSGSTASMTIEELVEEMSKSKEFSRAFDASGASGSGANGGTSASGDNGGAGASASKGAKTVRADDAAGLSANLEDIASGKTTVVAS